MRGGRLSTLLARGREPRGRVKWYWGQTSLHRHATLVKPHRRLVHDPAARVIFRGKFDPINNVTAAVNFEQTLLTGGDRFRSPVGACKGIMTIPPNDKHKNYARYAEHCLTMVTTTTDQDARALNREMAAEWLMLADAVLHPLKRPK
jgi:hypothetical protein